MARITPAGRAIHHFVDDIGLTVRHGPFMGMRFPDGATGHASFLGAKLLGAYESELHDALESLMLGQYRQIVDVGAAEGYYAVGLALRTPDHVRIEAFETDGGGRRLCREMAALNGVLGKISIAGLCNPRVLSSTLSGDACVLCDCEGYEYELLDPSVVPQLSSATILAELHPVVHSQIERIIIGRFSDTHDVTIIHPAPRNPAAWGELEGKDARTCFLLLSEGTPSEARAAQFRRCWAVMTPHR